MVNLPGLWPSFKKGSINSRKEVSPEDSSPGQHKDISKSQTWNCALLSLPQVSSALPSTTVSFLDWNPLVALDLEPQRYVYLQPLGSCYRHYWGRIFSSLHGPAQDHLLKSFAPLYLTSGLIQVPSLSGSPSKATLPPPQPKPEHPEH